MRRSVLNTAGLFTAALAIFIGAGNAYAQKAEVLEGEYIVQRDYTKALPRNAAPSMTVIDSSLTADLVRPASQANLHASSKSELKIVPLNKTRAEADCAEIKKDPSVTTCEPNHVAYNSLVPNDPLFDFYQFFLSTPAYNGTTQFDMRAAQGWDRTTGSDDVIIAITDSGINYEHGDLSPNLWINPGETANNNVDDDGNGYVDDVIGIDATNNNGNPIDCNGHGSHVAGIIGARGNNAKGVSGVCWNVKIIMTRNAIDCGPSVSVMSVIKGIDYIYDLKKNRGINISAMNASYGGSSLSESEKAAIARLATVNIIYVAASGNGGQDGIGDNLDISPSYPAAHDLDNIVSVANLGWNYENNGLGTEPVVVPVLNTSSNFGLTTVDIAAPGSSILSTTFKNDPEADFGSGIEVYKFLTGTSMASPATAGSIGLFVAKNPGFMKYTTIIDTLYSTSLKNSNLTSKIKTGGMVDLQQLLSASPTDNCPSDPNKLDAGVCGCGVTETYGDSDADGVVNCVDVCAGSADVDANGNGRVDCIDALIGAVVPAKPKFTKKSKTLDMTASAEPGVVYVVQIDSVKKVPGKKKPVKKTRFIESSTPSVKIGTPKSGESWTVTYFYRIPGSTNLDSLGSAKVKLKG